MFQKVLAAHSVGGPLMYVIAALSIAFIVVVALQLTIYKGRDIKWVIKTLFIAIPLFGLLGGALGFITLAGELETVGLTKAVDIGMPITLNMVSYALLVEFVAAIIYAFATYKMKRSYCAIAQTAMINSSPTTHPEPQDVPPDRLIESLAHP
ncbi:MAG: hypothetical protein GY847_21340 [Proteobacteria bacterium]|nr:hypothetical protein [Pseudomonadota bacterium]